MNNRQEGPFMVLLACLNFHSFTGLFSHLSVYILGYSDITLSSRGGDVSTYSHHTIMTVAVQEMLVCL